jgi:hypothetical protein
LAERRRLAAERHDPPIPPAPIPLERQYRPLTPQGKLLVAGYVRRVARTHPHPSDASGGGIKAVKVKVYLVDYSNAPVAHFQAGGDPLDPAFYAPYYLGEFDPEGRLTPESAADGLLYWLIPTRPPQPAAGPVVNYLRVHAGDGNEEGVP